MEKRTLIALPSYNEGSVLEEKITKLYQYTEEHLPNCDIILSDNNSTDNTRSVMWKLLDGKDRLFYHFAAKQGKGFAVKDAWMKARRQYDAYVFMDVDLATGLEVLPRLINSIRDGYDLSIGSRYLPASDAKRSLKRKIISKTYNGIFKMLFDIEVTDLQCGFKAISRKAKEELLPKIKDDGFFFDTELIIRASLGGYKISEVPIKWEENERSTVKLTRDVPHFISGLAKLKYEQISRKTV